MGTPREALITILDDNPEPEVSFATSTSSTPEGEVGVFTVSLSAPSGRWVTMDYASSDGMAQAWSDYVVVSGTLAFAPDQTTQTNGLPTFENRFVEPAETVTLRRSAGGHQQILPEVRATPAR